MDDQATHEREFWAALNVVIILLTVVLIMAVTAWLGIALDRSRADEHGPIGQGGSGGIQASRQVIATTTSAYLVSGASARGVAYSTLANDGTRPTLVLSADEDDVVTHVQWAPYPRSEDVVVFGPAIRWREFPATVGAQGEVRLRITFRRPHECAERRLRPGAGAFYDGSLIVHWLAGTDIRTSPIVGTRDESMSVQIC